MLDSKRTTIKVGYLISYDYEYMKTSLPKVYNFVEEIFLAVDSEGKTWSGENISIDNKFWEWIKDIDRENKITIYEDRFYIPGLTPMECDTRERNMLGKKMGISDWYVQIDSDEYFVDFESFSNKLRHFKPAEPTTVCCRVLTLFKQVSSGYLLMDSAAETLSFATNNPVYDLARNNSSGNKTIYWNDIVLHQSWARSKSEIMLKLSNWSHKNDFNTESFYKLWDAIDEYNYHCLSNFHPLYPITWPKLKMMDGSVQDILNSKQIREFKVIASITKKNFFSRLWKRVKG